jgi:glucose-6-phosphate 1-epimerase
MTDPSAVDLPASVVLTQGDGGLQLLDVSTSLAEAKLYLQGAHLAAWTPAGHDPVIWMSKATRYEKGQPIRGGIPICFPWFGAGREPGMAPAHGYARRAPWELVGAEDSAGTVTLTLRLTDAEVAGLAGFATWPNAFELSCVVTVGSELSVDLTVHNTGSDEYSFEEALHAYFQVGDVAQVTVGGLDSCRYVDKTAAGAGPDVATQEGRVAFTGETDRVYDAKGTATIHDPVMSRTITVHKEGSANTVVWNPWTAKASAMADFGDDEWTSMVCVETANALDDAITLAPGQRHTMTARYTVAAG